MCGIPKPVLREHGGRQLFGPPSLCLGPRHLQEGPRSLSRLSIPTRSLRSFPPFPRPLLRSSTPPPSRRLPEKTAPAKNSLLLLVSMYNGAYLRRNGSGSAAGASLEADIRRHAANAATVRSGHAVGRRAHTQLVKDGGELGPSPRVSALTHRC